METENKWMDASVGKLPFDRDSALYCYVVVRGDIPHGLQGAQAVHAALEAGRLHGNPPGLRVSLLTARDGEHLAELGSRLARDGVGMVDFHEPDWGIGLSAIATQPLRRGQAKALRSLPLFGTDMAGPQGR